MAWLLLQVLVKVGAGDLMKAAVHGELVLDQLI